MKHKPVKKRPVKRCPFCGTVVKAGYKSHGTVTELCDECFKMEEKKFIRLMIESKWF